LNHVEHSIRTLNLTCC